MRPCSIHLIWEKILGGRLTLVKVRESEAKFKDRKVWWSLFHLGSLPDSPGECTSIQIYRRRRAHTRSPVHSSRVSVVLSTGAAALSMLSGNTVDEKTRFVFARFRSPLTFPSSTTILHYKFFIPKIYS